MSTFAMMPFNLDISYLLSIREAQPLCPGRWMLPPPRHVTAGWQTTSPRRRSPSRQQATPSTVGNQKLLAPLIVRPFLNLLSSRAIICKVCATKARPCHGLGSPVSAPVAGPASGRGGRHGTDVDSTSARRTQALKEYRDAQWTTCFLHGINAAATRL
jgi:hypothetical protein